MGKTSSKDSIISRGPLYALWASFSPQSSSPVDFCDDRSLFLPIDDVEDDDADADDVQHWSSETLTAGSTAASCTAILHDNNFLFSSTTGESKNADAHVTTRLIPEGSIRIFGQENQKKKPSKCDLLY